MSKVSKKNYYLVVGRFVPENSFEIMIREFMKSKSKAWIMIYTNLLILQKLESHINSRSIRINTGKNQ